MLNYVSNIENVYDNNTPTFKHFEKEEQRVFSNVP